MNLHFSILLTKHLSKIRRGVSGVCYCFTLPSAEMPPVVYCHTVQDQSIKFKGRRAQRIFLFWGHALKVPIKYPNR